MATETPIYAITTQDMPTGMDAQPAQQNQPSATPAPVPTFGTSPFGSSMGGMSGMTGMSGGMAGMSGMDMSASCPMMGQMSSGTTGMSGMGMSSMGMSTTGMAGMTTMTGTESLYDADGRFVLWNLNPWWVLGWVLLALILLAVLASAVFGVVTLVRRTRRPAPVAPDQP
jgi:hypothetical protein